MRESACPTKVQALAHQGGIDAFVGQAWSLSGFFTASDGRGCVTKHTAAHRAATGVPSGSGAVAASPPPHLIACALPCALLSSPRSFLPVCARSWAAGWRHYAAGCAAVPRIGAAGGPAGAVWPAAPRAGRGYVGRASRCAGGPAGAAWPAAPRAGRGGEEQIGR